MQSESQATPEAALPRLEPLEIHSGHITGPRRAPAPRPQPEIPGDARQVLDVLLAGALAHPPCYVAFSGGRDSSVVLAAATDTARRHGLAEPIPLTARFEDYPRTHESDWQEFVVTSLGLEDWVRFPVTSEWDALGEPATRALLRHGLYWPTQAYSMLVFGAHAAPGTLLTGGGGDESLTGAARYRARLREIASVRPLPQALKLAAITALPHGLRVALLHRRHPLSTPWLRPEVERELAAQVLREARERPPSWRGELEQLISSRYYELVRAVLERFAEDAGVRLVEPFYDPRFIRAFAAGSPPAGYPNRTAALQASFSDLLHPDVLRRSTKAAFTEAAWGSRARAFVEAWDGSGVDLSLVDPERLREEWRKPSPDARSVTSLHQAWLASQA
jgi:asparagine synthase (glutamine-hydrolysing)